MLAVPVFAIGFVVVAAVFASSIRTVLLPRGVSAKLGRFVFVSLRILFKVRIRRNTPYEVRDRVLAYYAPLALVALLVTWVVGVVAGYTAMLWAVGVHPIRAAFTMSTASITTLGFVSPHGMPQTVLVVTEAGLGLIELAMLITFLPNIYGDFHSREREVTKLRTQAGQPPQGVNILVRLHRLERLDARTDLWVQWIDWFVEVEDNSTAFPALSFFRSPLPEYSWVTAAGAVLDGAALAAACLDRPRDLEAELCLRTGYLCLRRIADIFRLPHDPNPAPDDPIAVTRDEFMDAWDQMASIGMPLRADRDAAWRAFAGWRVNYDEALIRLANVIEAPIAPWSSDRGLLSGRKMTFIERIRV